MKKIKKLTDKEKEVLIRIQNSIPKEWLDNVTKKEMLAPKSAKLIRDIATGNKNDDIDISKVTAKDIENAKYIIDSGKIEELEKLVEVENTEITKQIDRFIDSEIEKSMARGELPKSKKFRNLNKKIKWKK